MKKKLYTENELLKTVIPKKAHSDERVKVENSDWNSFFKNDHTVDENFMNAREDVIEESSRSIFDDDYFEDQDDIELIKERENQPEIDVDINDL